MLTVVAVVTDNAYNIVGAIKLLAAKSNSTGWRHVACFAHTLSLVVKGAIEKNTELSPLLSKARALVTFFHSSHKATAKLTSLCKDRTSKVLAQDVATRWNSTLIMLRSLLDLQSYVQDVLSSIKINRRDLDLSEMEWDTLVNVIDVLQPFQELTKELSSQNYPSISKCIPSVVLLTRWLRNTHQTVHTDCQKRLISDLLDGISKRFDNTQKIWHSTPHLIGTYLDPRYKI